MNPDPSPADQASLRATVHAVSTVRRRRSAFVLLRAASWSVAAACTLAAATLVTLRLTGIQAPWWPIATLGLGSLAAVAGSIWAARSFWDASRAAREIDHASQTDDALSSGLAFGDAQGPIAELIRNRAEDQSSRASPHTVVPYTNGWRGPSASLVACGLVVAAGLWMPTRTSTIRYTTDPVALATAKAEVQAVKNALLADVPADVPTPEPSANIERAKEEIEQLEAELASGTRSPESARAKVAETLTQAADRAEQSAQATEDSQRALREAMAKAAKRAALPSRSRGDGQAASPDAAPDADANSAGDPQAGQSPVDDLLNALERGDWEAAAQAAEQLETASAEMTEQERTAEADKLREFADNLEATADQNANPNAAQTASDNEPQSANNNDQPKAPATPTNPADPNPPTTPTQTDAANPQNASNSNNAPKPTPSEPNPQPNSQPESKPDPSGNSSPNDQQQNQSPQQGEPQNAEQGQTSQDQSNQDKTNQDKQPSSTQQAREMAEQARRAADELQRKPQPQPDANQSRPTEPKQAKQGEQGEQQPQPQPEAQPKNPTEQSQQNEQGQQNQQPQPGQQTKPNEPSAQPATQPATQPSREPTAQPQATPGGEQSPKAEPNQQGTPQPTPANSSDQPSPSGQQPKPTPSPNGQPPSPSDKSGQRMKGLVDQIDRLRQQNASGKVDRQQAESLRNRAEQLMKGMSPEERAELEKAAREWAEKNELPNDLPNEPQGDQPQNDRPSPDRQPNNPPSNPRTPNGDQTGDPSRDQPGEPSPSQSNGRPVARTGPQATPTNRNDSPLPTAKGDVVRPPAAESDPASGGQTLAEWLAEPGKGGVASPGRTAPSASDVKSGAARAIEERRVPKGYDDLVRRVFSRIGDRLPTETTPPADGPKSLAPAAAPAKPAPKPSK